MSQGFTAEDKAFLVRTLLETLAAGAVFALLTFAETVLTRFYGASL